jgi:hypothetical protein
MQPENTDAMQLWLAVRTQWRAGGMGVVGLDYAEVRRWARDLDMALSPGLWSKSRRLEYFELERQAGHADRQGEGHSQTAAGPAGGE